MDSKTVHKLSTKVPTLARKLDLSKFEVRYPRRVLINNIVRCWQQIQKLHPVDLASANHRHVRPEWRPPEARLHQDHLRGGVQGPPRLRHRDPLRRSQTGRPRVPPILSSSSSMTTRAHPRFDCWWMECASDLIVWHVQVSSMVPRKEWFWSLSAGRIHERPVYSLRNKKARICNTFFSQSLSEMNP